jgi:hypothetical protein
MKNKSKHRDGYHFETDEICEDGSEVRVPLHLVDSFRLENRVSFGELAELDAADLDRYRPGHRVADAPTRDSVRLARQEMIDRATRSWMDGKRREPPDDDESEPVQRSKDARDPRVGARAAYDAMCSRLRGAWRTPVRDLAEPDYGEADPGKAGAIERRAERERSPPPPPPDPRSAAERDREYEQRKLALSTAWQTTGPPNYYTKRPDPGLRRLK